MKVVINKCYGGYGISKKALARLVELKDKHISKQSNAQYYGTEDFQEQRKKDANSLLANHFLDSDLENIYSDEHRWEGDEARTCPLLVQVVEELGSEANGRFADLRVVEIPDGVEFEIEEYDGIEWIAEKHQTWG